ncbi:MAG: sugar phosphate isomerase/epimerase [Ruminococcus flavefaciens]|nr:sugar phosphate isomerase/epimerase [Ruminococcus flavefaciens]MCM1228620.1 sugar phosphate isomerase/epimerase [Ruminococcus flavefaciens]
MRAGVSTACLYPELLEDSLYRLAVSGVQCTEIFVNTNSELRRGYALGLKDMMCRFDVQCVSVHPFTSEIEPLMLFSDYERRLTDSLEYYKSYFQFMNIVGAEVFVFHGGKADRGKDFYCERYSRLFRLGKEFGITVAVENVSRCQSASSAFIHDISGMLGDEFAFVLDTKQAVRSGESPFAFLESAGKKTVHVHISDSGEMGDCLLIGKGNFRFRQFLERLNGYNPEANVIVELYRSSFSGISELVHSYVILDRMIRSVK